MTDGFCNCNQCEETNTSLVVDVTLSKVECPKETRYFKRGGQSFSLFSNFNGITFELNIVYVYVSVCIYCIGMSLNHL